MHVTGVEFEIRVCSGVAENQVGVPHVDDVSIEAQKTTRSSGRDTTFHHLAVRRLKILLIKLNGALQRLRVDNEIRCGSGGSSEEDPLVRNLNCRNCRRSSSGPWQEWPK